MGNFPEDKTGLNRLNIMVAATDEQGAVMDEAYGQLSNIEKTEAGGFYEIILTDRRPNAIQALVSDPVTGAHTLFRFPGNTPPAQQIAAT